VDRLSPEAPVPVVKLVDEYFVPGMAANVHLNLKNLGIEADFVFNDEEIIKTRYIDQRSGQHLLRVDQDPTVTSWSGRTPFPLDTYDAIVISDYNKGFLTYEGIEQIIKNATCPIFIDTKKTQLADISAEHVYFKINELEYNNSQSRPSNLIITLGDRGAMFTSPSSTKMFETKKVEVMDVCGCGDTFLAALTYHYLMTNNIDDAIIFANKAASLTVQHRGNYAPTLEEINNARY
jgi:D-beta-D-heptose 7-phosphate kinase/D-beta-D-heptose 1-phosphate adenosyltransferase